MIDVPDERESPEEEEWWQEIHDKEDCAANASDAENDLLPVSPETCLAAIESVDSLFRWLRNVNRDRAKEILNPVHDPVPGEWPMRRFS